MQRLVGLLLVLCVAGAYAADDVYSHFVAGKFTRLGSIPANGLARWQDGAWFTPASSSLTGNILDYEPHKSGDVIFLVRDGEADRVIRYSPAQDTYVQIGYEFRRNSVRDMAVLDDTVYVCGSNLITANVANTVNVASHTISSDAETRTVWSPLAPPTTGSIPVCRAATRTAGSLIVMGTTTSPIFLIIEDASNSLFWRSDSTKDWTNQADTAGADLRMGGGVTIRPARWLIDDGYLYLSPVGTGGGATTFSIAAVNDIYIARSKDGRTWSAVTQFAASTTLNFPSGAPFVVSGGDVYTFLSKPVNRGALSPSFVDNAAIYKNSVVGGTGSPTRVSDANVQIGTDGYGNPSPFNQNTLAVLYDGKIVFMVDSPSVLYTDAGVQLDDPFILYSRNATKIGNTFSWDLTTATWDFALGGGFQVSDYADLPKMVVNAGADKKAVWLVGNFNTLFNKVAFGLAAYNSQKGWVPMGNPTRTYNYDLPAEAANPETDNVRAMHVFPSEGASQYVVIAGDFRRIANTTVNGIAYMRTDAPNNWSPMGATGLVAAGPNGAQLDTTLLYYARPGKVYAIASFGSTSATKKDIFVGGNFIGSAPAAGESGAGSFTPLNNIAKYEFGSSHSGKWVALGGGIGGEVYAIDTAGKKVFVGGAFSRAGNLTVSNIAMWDDDKKVWSSLQVGVAGVVTQILARSESDVFVVTANGNNGGGVAATGNVHWWNGQKWVRIGCDTCRGCDSCHDCYNKNKLDSCSVNDVRELKFIGGVMYRRSNGGALSYYDGSQWRQFSESNVGAGSGMFNRVMAPGINGGRILLAHPAGQVVSALSSNIAEFGTEDNNVYPVVGSGFDSSISEIVGIGSTGAALVPMMAMFAFVLLALLF